MSHEQSYIIAIIMPHYEIESGMHSISKIEFLNMIMIMAKCVNGIHDSDQLPAK